jgi:predicted nucleic acid-binding protein
MLKIYLDTCCYNRPFDNLDQHILGYEAAAIGYIENLIRVNKVKLVHSFILQYEIDDNPSFYKRLQINDVVRSAAEFVSEDLTKVISEISAPIIATGVKKADAAHVACALFAHCDFFITTDKRLLKYKSDDIIITDPINFLIKWRDEYEHGHE